ncbi:MAG: UDP-2,3-diacylglucosamine diphosphatase [Flammeovirgaceae bacterium]|nr:UDP-2,3-diacylglucosamine diphosphatase [Flammeovirgaceae bacterium]
MKIDLLPGKKIYFASDFHLGFPSPEESVVREKLIIKWLDDIKNDAQHIFLLGDIFDFWFDYKYVVPKGFIRFLGKLSELIDSGITITFFTGNHDLWMFDYFEKELGIKVYYKPTSVLINKTQFHLAHGDGLGPGDTGYKLLKLVFTNKLCQWLFGVLNPNIGMWFALKWSTGKKHKKMSKGLKFYGEKEFIFIYCQEIEQKSHHDYYLMGHRHIPYELEVMPNSKYINIGDWIENNTYAVFDGNNVDLITYK